MNNEPVAWIDKNTGKPRMEGFIQTDHDIPLYTAEQIIEKNKPEIEKANAYIKLLEAEIKALKAVLEQEGIGVGRDLLNGGIALFRKASEK